ncbi:hypothetical protein ABL78_6768 [Leptomonas seymouri]|uniref:Uncharacterized protein n=1 Tax=Leptomonas seymouri TaxID=5684 RepID=A0A0N0P3I9_LEPSE|nr:hypothetical protein ABL78_6768 [Leptomonas seymouri]|eukprot:KPI84179.1 hypothetical protein ABL78_6768 [Leptomonas seymouri]
MRCVRRGRRATRNDEGREQEESVVAAPPPAAEVSEVPAVVVAVEVGNEVHHSEPAIQRTNHNRADGAGNSSNNRNKSSRGSTTRSDPTPGGGGAAAPDSGRPTKHSASSQAWPSPQRNSAGGKKTEEPPLTPSLSMGPCEARGRGVAEMAGQTSASTAHKEALQQPSQTTAAPAAATATNARNGAAESAEPRKSRSEDKRRVVKATKHKNKNMKGVTASIPATHLRKSEGVLATVARLPLPSPQQQQAGRTSDSAVSATEPRPSSTRQPFSGSSSENATHEIPRVAGGFPTQQQSPTVAPTGSSEQSLSNGGTLTRGLCVPATLLEHHARLRPADVKGPALVPEQQRTATAEALRVTAARLPDRCVVKVVSALASAEGGEAQSGGKETWRDAYAIKQVGAAKAMSLRMGATTTTAAAPSLPSRMSEEDKMLSRRGLRFEAAPWSPVGCATLFVGEEEAAATPAASMPYYPLSSAHLRATVRANAALHPAECLPFFAAPSRSTGVDTSSLTFAAVPAVKITSTLTKGVGEESTEALVLSSSPSSPSLPARSGATRGPVSPTSSVATGTAASDSTGNGAVRSLSPSPLNNAANGAAGGGKDGGGGGGSTGTAAGSPQSLVERLISPVAPSYVRSQGDSSPLGGSMGSPSNVAHTSVSHVHTMGASSPGSAAAWGSHSLPPSLVMREDDGESTSGTPLMMSPALNPATVAARTVRATAETAAEDRPATAPAIRRSAMTVTNTATGARVSPSTLNTPSGSPIALRAAVDGMCVRLHLNSNAAAAAVIGGSAAAVSTPTWTSSGLTHPAAIRSAGSADSSTCEFPAMPFPVASTHHHPSPHQRQCRSSPQLPQNGYPSLSSLGNDVGDHNLAELSSSGGGMGVNVAASAVSPTGMAGASHSGGSSHLSSPQLSLQNPSLLLLGNLQFPHCMPNSSLVSGGGGGHTATTGNASSPLLFQTQNSSGSPPRQRESDADRVRHNRVAVSDVAAKSETTLVDTLFADAEADVIEDDDSEMDIDDGMSSGGGGVTAAPGDCWPAYPIGTSPHASLHSPDAYAHAYAKQKRQQHGYLSLSSPTASRGGTTYGGGYWNQSGSGSNATAGQPRRHSGSGSGRGNGAARAHFSPEGCTHRAVSVSCASVASSTMSLLDPKQLPADPGPAAYDGAEDEEEWEVNSSAYADSLDEAQIQWIEEQLRATENPEGFF